MRYFLIAGEASGDLHASHLIAALRQADPQAQFEYLGGDLMASAAEAEPVVHYRDMAYMGFVDVVRHLPQIRRNAAAARRAIREWRPDCLILVDYPGFNLPMADYARGLGIPVVYYISPKVWAWKEYRVRQIRRSVDLMLCILPFEVDFYARHGMDVTYVGNPSVAEVDQKLAQAPGREEFLRAHGLSSRPIIALLPGSRKGEIADNLPVMLAAAARYPDCQAVVAGAPGIDADFYARFGTDVPVVRDSTFALLRHARAALVTSGTATLETALAGVPQVALYRSVGWRVAYEVMKRWLKVRYVTLPNLILDRPVIPELLLHQCTPDAAATALGAILPDSPEREAMLRGYADMRARLGTSEAAATAARAIVGLVKR